MGFGSLIKRKSVGDTEQPKSCTIDAFIEDADAYAAGFPRVVGAQKSMPDRRREDRLKEMQCDLPEGPEFRHATFTLTLDVIDKLNILAQRDQFNKSKLIRILIENHIRQSKSQRVQIYREVETP